MDCSIVPIKHKHNNKHNNNDDDQLSIISTTDFFYPLVDDPYVQGQVGACNVLSDMYAMGVVDVDNMLMILASSDGMDPRTRDIVTRKMIEGFSDLCKSAGVEVTGGQTVINPWPIIGGTAMSCCTSDQYIYPVNAVPGDVLILTKPLGTQIAVNVNVWLQLEDTSNWIKAQEVLSYEEAMEAYQTTVQSMTALNRNAARLMHKYGAHAATDITGFGIIGHATNLAKNQKLPLNFKIHTLPIIKKMELVDKLFPFFRLLGGLSSETSGGLLIAIASDKAELFCKEIAESDQFPSWIIGDVVSHEDPSTTTSSTTIPSTTTGTSANTAYICPSPKIIHV